MSVLFIVSIFLGYFLAGSYPEKMEETIVKDFKDMIEPARGLTPLRLFEFIFLKNLIAAVACILSGIILGFIPVTAIFANGLILGIVSFIFLREFSAVALLSGLAPHGIIEIPALIFSAASGVWLWRSIWRRLVYGEKKVIAEFVSIAKFFIFVIAPMLFAAAMIEVFITPQILSSAG